MEGSDGDQSSVSDLRFTVKQSFGGSVVFGEDEQEDASAEEMGDDEDDDELHLERIFPGRSFVDENILPGGDYIVE